MKLTTPRLSLRRNCGLICLLQTVQVSIRLWPCVSVSLLPTEQSKCGYGVMTQSTGLSGWQGDFLLPTGVYSQLLTKGDFHLIAGSFLEVRELRALAHTLLVSSSCLITKGQKVTPQVSREPHGSDGVKLKLWKSPTVQCVCAEHCRQLHIPPGAWAGGSCVKWTIHRQISISPKQ